MEAAPPNPLNEGIEIIEKKEYILNEKYSLIIERDLYYLYFKLSIIDDISLFCYKNKFDLQIIIQLMKVNSNIYNNLEKIFKLIEDCYSNNKISVKINDNNIDLILKINQNDILIHLEKSDIDLNQRFEAVIEEIKCIKKKSNNLIDDRLYGIEFLLKEIENDTNIKINEEKKEIDNFQKTILKSMNDISGNIDEINELKERISNIKKQKENLNI